MVNRPKKTGTAAETRVVNFLLAAGFLAYRVALSGNHDNGDVHIVSPDGSLKICLEVKGGKQTDRIGRALMTEWLEQTVKETKHSEAAAGYLVIAKHMASPCDYLVYDAHTRRFCYLDEFVEDPTLQPARRIPA